MPVFPGMAGVAQNFEEDTSSSSVPLGGVLSHTWETWKKARMERWTHSTVHFGCRIPFLLASSDFDSTTEEVSIPCSVVRQSHCTPARSGQDAGEEHSGDCS